MAHTLISHFEVRFYHLIAICASLRETPDSQISTVVKTPAEAGTTFDIVVCAHKAIGQDKVPAILAPAVDEKTTLVIIQNGVGNEEPFRKAFPQTTIITCVVGRVTISISDAWST